MPQDGTQHENGSKMRGGSRFAAGGFWSAAALKRVLILYWAVWLSVVVITNIFNGLIILDVLGSSWEITSGNYGFIAQTTKIYDIPRIVNEFLFLGVIIWETVGAILLWRAFTRFRGTTESSMRPVYLAFIVTISLFAAFTVVTEIFIAFNAETTFRRIFIAQLLSVYVIQQLPE